MNLEINSILHIPILVVYVFCFLSYLYFVFQQSRLIYIQFPKAFLFFSHYTAHPTYILKQTLIFITIKQFTTTQQCKPNSLKRLNVVILNYSCFAKFNLILQKSGIHAVYSYINHHISSPVMQILTLSRVFSAKRKVFKNITTISLYVVSPKARFFKIPHRNCQEKLQSKEIEINKDT